MVRGAPNADPARRRTPPLADRLRLIAVTAPPSETAAARCPRPPAVAERRRGDRPASFLESVVGEVLRAGAPAVQLREKRLPPRALLPLARRLRRAAHAAGTLFFVNDRLDLALAAQADGIHLGPDDLPVPAARRLAPPPFLIGASARTPDSARTAEAAGADYIGCGPVFASRTKPRTPIGLDRLAAVAAAVQIPVVAIGGLDAHRAPAAHQAGAAGAAAARALMAAPDPHAAAKAILAAFPRVPPR